MPCPAHPNHTHQRIGHTTLTVHAYRCDGAQGVDADPACRDDRRPGAAGDDRAQLGGGDRASESALQKLTEHPATLSLTVSAEVVEEQMSSEVVAVAATPIMQPSDGADDGSGQWYHVAMPVLLRAGPSLSSHALERLEVGGVVQALQPEVECEGWRRLQVAGHVFGRGWCSLETGSAEPILRELPLGATSSRSAS